MFSKLFRKCTEEINPLPSSHILKQTSDMLEEKENVLQKKIAIEVERAKEFTRANNKQAALQCLKRKKFYEVKMEQLGSFQLRIHNQVEQINSNVKSNHAKSSQLKRDTSSNNSVPTSEQKCEGKQHCAYK